MNRELRIREEAATLRSVLGVVPDGKGNDTVDHHDELLLRGILAGGRSPRVRRRSPQRVPMYARIAFACATVTTVVVGVLSWQSGRDPAAATPPVLEFSALSVEDVIAGQGVSARDALGHIADRASALPIVDGQGSQFVSSYAWYLTTTVDEDGHSTVELAPTFQTTTIAPDGSYTSKERRASALSIDGRVIDPDHYPVGGAGSMDELPAGTFDATYPASLPREPEALRQAILAANGGSETCEATDQAEATCLYYGIVDLFTRWVVPSDLAATIWRMVADSPAMVDMGDTTDRLARQGHAVAIPPASGAGNEVRILIIDPVSGQLLSWEQVAVEMPDLDLDTPVVSGFQAISTAQWVTP